MGYSRSDELGPDAPGPCEIAAQYELYSQRSTAVNEVLVKLRAALLPSHLPPEWDEALKVNRLSMWLHQVLAFEHALGCIRQRGKQLAKERGRKLRDGGQALKKSAEELWPGSSARTIYRSLAELGEILALESDGQFRLEIMVAPRHFIWRDAWVHRAGGLQVYHPETFAYFRERQALEERDGSAWPLDPAWSEARLSFNQLVRLLTARCGPSEAAPGHADP